VVVERCDASIPQSALLSVSGPVHCALIAVWPVEKPLSYAAILQKAIAEYLPETSAKQTLIAGDLNSSTRAVKQRSSHPKLVKALSDRGLRSVYHHQEAVEHGSEPIWTFRRGKTELFIDYVFASSDLLGAASLSVPRTDAWIGASDHLPVIVDIADSAFRRAAP
jgi:endonuclease/exonuclease/phosphatase family metal-dependent hydrolase